MKNLQKGRSMIEMLGVLAIIGVLSIGGLAGYTMAMNRYRANTLTDYVMRCGVVAQTSGMGTTPKTGSCADLLHESVPGFLTSSGSGDNLVAASCTVDTYAGGKDPQDITITCKTVTPSVNEVLTAKFGSDNVGGVKYSGATTGSAIYTFTAS